jgi:hypothetical protein
MLHPCCCSHPSRDIVSSTFPRGYCTPEELDEVGGLEGVRRLKLGEFIELLKW